MLRAFTLSLRNYVYTANSVTPHRPTPAPHGPPPAHPTESIVHWNVLGPKTEESPKYLIEMKEL